jgi:hypothetical protein
MAAGLPWGILGVSFGYTIASFSFFYYTLVVAFRVIGLTLAEFHRVLIRPFGATLAMVGIVVVTAPLLGRFSSVERLSLSVGVGIVAYAAISMIVNRSQLVELKSIWQSLRSAPG